MNRETAMMMSRRIKVLFILAIVTAVTSTLGGNLLADKEGIAFAAGIVSNVCNIAYGIILTQMEKGCRRYWRAGMTMLVSAELMLLLEIFVDVQAMDSLTFVLLGLLASISAIGVMLYGMYSEFKAHAEVLTGIGNPMAKKWITLWSYTLTGYLLMLFAGIMLMGYIMLFAVVLSAVAAVMLLVTSIVRFVYLYKTMKALENYGKDVRE